MIALVALRRPEQVLPTGSGMVKQSWAPFLGFLQLGSILQGQGPSGQALSPDTRRAGTWVALPERLSPWEPEHFLLLVWKTLLRKSLGVYCSGAKFVSISKSRTVPRGTGYMNLNRGAGSPQHLSINYHQSLSELLCPSAEPHCPVFTEEGEQLLLGQDHSRACGLEM